MATAPVKEISPQLKPIRPRSELGPDSAGILMTPEEFEKADFLEGWRYELINGVLVVAPFAGPGETDPNEELGYLLRVYRDALRGRSSMDQTLYERTWRTKKNWRRSDRAIWIGLGRRPKRNDTPTIVAEFVSAGKAAWRRDYEQKKDEYMEAGVKEYWVFDRFALTMTVFYLQGKKIASKVIHQDERYTTPLLPGFELPVGHLLQLARDWPEEEPEPI